MRRLLFAVALLWPGASFAAELIQHLPTEPCLAARSAASADEQLLQWTQCLASEPLTAEQRAAAYVVRGTLYESKQDYKNALADFNSAIAADPALAIAFAARGALYIVLNNPSSAVPDLSEAIRLDPTMAQAYLARGVALVSTNRPDEAIADFTMAMKIDTKLVLPALELRALAYASKQDWAGTIADSTAALKLSNDPALLYVRAAAYVNSHQYAKAIPDFSAIIERDPNNALAYNNRSVAYSALKQYPLAIADLTKAISLAPGDARFYTERGSVYDNTGDCKNALGDIDHALSIAEDGMTDNAKAWVRATCPDSTYRNGAEALTLAIRAIQLGAGSSFFDERLASIFHMTLAAAYAESGQFDDAVHEQDLAIKLMTKDASDDLKSETALAMAAFKAKKPFRWPADAVVSSLMDAIASGGGTALGFAPAGGSTHLRLAHDAPSPIVPQALAMPPLPPVKLPY